MKLEHTMTGVVLSSNDVIATILFVDSDEEGLSPIAIEQVSLPEEYRRFRRLSDIGESVLKRGDIIKVTVNVEKDTHGQKLNEAQLNSVVNLLSEREDDDLPIRLNEEAKKFDVEWKDLCRRELANRKKEETKTT